MSYLNTLRLGAGRSTIQLDSDQVYRLIDQDTRRPSDVAALIRKAAICLGGMILSDKKVDMQQEYTDRLNNLADRLEGDFKQEED